MIGSRNGPESEEVGIGTALASRAIAAEVGLAIAGNPRAILAEASEACKALQEVIAQKPKPVTMNGEQYLEFEDWMTVGRFYGVTACEEGEPEYVSYGGVEGFKATSVALSRTGQVLSRATGLCMRDEEKWGYRTKYAWGYLTTEGGWSEEDPGRDLLVWEDYVDRNTGEQKRRPKRERREVGAEEVPLFQLASMAQTRANAKVLRNVLAWAVVLAGYRPTPAEELTGRFDDEPYAPPPAQTSSRPAARRGAERAAPTAPRARSGATGGKASGGAPGASEGQPAGTNGSKGARPATMEELTAKYVRTWQHARDDLHLDTLELEELKMLAEDSPEERRARFDRLLARVLEIEVLTPDDPDWVEWLALRAKAQKGGVKTPEMALPTPRADLAFVVKAVRNAVEGGGGDDGPAPTFEETRDALREGLAKAGASASAMPHTWGAVEGEGPGGAASADEERDDGGEPEEPEDLDQVPF